MRFNVAFLKTRDMNSEPGSLRIYLFEKVTIVNKGEQ
jgi:hypothetical protein